LNDRAWTAVEAAIVIEVGVDGPNVAVPVGTTFVFQLPGVFQSVEMAPTHVAFWAKATPETPFKTMTGIAMRAARVRAALASTAVARRRGRFGSGSPNGREPFVRRHGCSWKILLA
jgi:hypothetical protein